jgi:hypothetical protein
MLTCLFCKILFSPKKVNNKNPRKYCCYQCSVASKKPKVNRCEHCGTETRNAKFCSRSCAVTINNTGKTHSAFTKNKIAESVRSKIISEDKKEETKNKRLTTYRKNNVSASRECIGCKKLISKKNKHCMCQSCYLESDAAVKAWGHFSKTYNKGYVFSPYANKEIYLLSGLEISYATWLNKNNIKWDKPKSISYQLNGKSKKYYPDFLLVDSNEIIEIKGYWWSGDKEKMLAVTTQNPNLDIKILTSKELNKLGIKSIRADTSL